MMSAIASTRWALGLRSSRLPIGVPTTYSVPKAPGESVIDAEY
jgi:hypothetical protein